MGHAARDAVIALYHALGRDAGRACRLTDGLPTGRQTGAVTHRTPQTVYANNTLSVTSLRNRTNQ